MKTRSTNRLWITLSVVALFVIALAVAMPAGPAMAQDPAAAIETIDLTSWKARDGRTLAEVMKRHSVAIFALVDPSCDTCTKAQDSMRGLRERVVESNMGYFVLMVPSDSDTSKYFAYADSLKLDAEAFVWSNSEAKPPASVTSLAAPSHLLVSTEGMIANKWAGIPEKF